MRALPIVLAACLGAIVVAKAPTCNMGTSHQHMNYPPANSTFVPWFTVQLDQPALTRWSHVVAPQKAEIDTLTNVVIKTLRKLLGNTIVDGFLKAINARLDTYTSALPNDYGDEIKGIAAATDIDPAVIFMYNMFYTVFGACTSIVAESSTQEMFHARNLDFGLWPSFNFSKGELWELTAALRPLVINVDMQRNGSTVYKATTFNGFVGVHTAVRGGALSLTIDSRFDDHLDAGLLKWLAAPHLDAGHEITMACRATVESSNSYSEGLEAMNKTKVLGPGYIILGGPEAGQGAVLTKGAAGLFKPDGETVAVATLADQLKNGSHYLVQTNYDGDADGSHPASKIDDRRDPAKLCMKALGPEGTNFTGLYNLLSSTPNLNRLTAYTTLMSVKTGELEAYHQRCDTRDCPLF